jgi:hypothetical protein
MPPLQALVALHGLWVLALLTLAAWAVRSWPPRRLRVAGCALIAVGSAALAVVIGRELLTWYPAVTPAQQKYFGQRVLYVIGTNTDLPVVQVLLVGVTLWLAGRRRKRGISSVRAQTRPAEGLFKEVAAPADHALDGWPPPRE